MRLPSSKVLPPVSGRRGWRVASRPPPPPHSPPGETARSCVSIFEHCGQYRHKRPRHGSLARESGIQQRRNRRCTSRRAGCSRKRVDTTAYVALHQDGRWYAELAPGKAFPVMKNMRARTVLLDSKHLEEVGAAGASTNTFHAPLRDTTVDRTVGWPSRPAAPVGLWNCCIGMTTADFGCVLRKHLVCVSVCVW